MRSPRGRVRVLVVDDQPEMAETIADGLSDRGYEVVATSSGRDALERLAAERFDAVVTDLRMPQVDGLALLRASLALGPSRPVITMTGCGVVDAAIQARDQGAYHHLVKPFRLDELARLIERALEGS